MIKPLFETNADAVLADVQATYATRGKEYSDTWANGQWNATRQTLEVLDLCATTLTTLEQRRLLVAASLVDVKIARFGGPYKEDTAIDLIAYLGNWVGEMRKIQEIRAKYNTELNDILS